MTKNAASILKKSSQRANVMSSAKKSKATKAKNSVVAKQYLKEARTLAKQSKTYTKQMHSITSGQKKAGRDFVVNSTYSSNLFLDPILLNVRKESRVEF